MKQVTERPQRNLAKDKAIDDVTSVLARLQQKHQKGDVAGMAKEVSAIRIAIEEAKPHGLFFTEVPKDFASRDIDKRQAIISALQTEV